MNALARLVPRDPRVLQIAFLATFLALGMASLGFQVEPWMPPLLLATACATQFLCERLLHRPMSGCLSPLISALGLSLLLRTDTWWVAPLAAVVAIASKFLIRVRGKHVFNPTNLGLTVAILVTGHAWCSPAQWGEWGILLAWLFALGLAVVHRSFRTDVSLAFLASWVLLKGARVLLLGQRPAVLLHQLSVGSLILFAFFMISDPKTTPDRRMARIGFGVAVAGLAFWLQHQWWVMNSPVWALLLLSPLVPLVDRLFPAPRFQWPTGPLTEGRNVRFSRLVVPALFAAVALTALPARAFCGFYVGKADSQLFNDASQVVLVRDGDRTVLTMSNDYQGPMSEFALVVPVPTVLQKEQIHIGDRKLLEHLDAYSAPRLVEYFDSDPCRRYQQMEMKAAARAAPASNADMAGGRGGDAALGVTVEARYTVGEYDILLLSAKESSGLETWLRQNGYRIPARASAALQPYIRQDMKFFVAKVNLQEQAALGVQYLRPLQIAYESRKFMLPIRLGMANARGPQDMVVYALTRQGRVESVNYRTTRVPSDVNVPEFVKDEFGKFYKATFAEALHKEGGRALFTEYTWDMGWCDPCAAQPLSREELQQLGVFWLEDGGLGAPWNGSMRRPGPPARGGVNVLLTRLHVRYDADHFPEDLVFQETGDRGNFQARYVLQHAFTGSMDCSAADAYRRSVVERHGKEAQTLADLTGWSMADIRRQMGPDALPPQGDPAWWKRIWK
jgi:Na+-translocating ferredoxin:NAD+ oxidoreductase RnfD subunit